MQVTQEQAASRGWQFDLSQAQPHAWLGQAEPRVTRYGSSLEDLLKEIDLWESGQDRLRIEARHPLYEGR